MHIRSYARAFPTDRRIYRIDRWAIPIPGGLPLAASAWFLALAIAVGAIGQLPVASAAIGVLGWPAAIIVAPGAGAVALTKRCDDGRTLPRLALDRATYLHRAACVVVPEPGRLARRIFVAADSSLAGRTIIHGPGRVRFDSTMHARITRSRVLLEATGSGARRAATLLALGSGERIEVRS